MSAGAEAVLVYVLVAVAAGVVVWRVVLPRELKARLSGKRAKGCGDGGCDNCKTG